MAKYLIIGVDPGLTTAVAITDLSGNSIILKSKKEFSKSEIIKFVSEYGRPLIISTDKANVPFLIEKLAAAFGCRVFNPSQDLSVEEKNELAKNVQTNDIHEKDAFAAAMVAYKSHASQFSKIDLALSSLGLDIDPDTVKKMIIEKKAKNIQEAIDKLTKKKEKTGFIITNWKQRAKELQRRLEELQKSYSILKDYSFTLENRLKNIEKQKQQLQKEGIEKSEETRKEVIENKEMLFRDYLIKSLKAELEKERELRKKFGEKFEKEEELKKIESEELLPVILIDSFNKESIAKKDREISLSDRILYFKNYRPSLSAAKFLVLKHPKIIIASLEEKEMELLKRAGVINIRGIKPKFYKHYGSLIKEELEEAVNEQTKKSFLNWLKSYKKR